MSKPEKNERPITAALDDPAEKWLARWRRLDFSWAGLAEANWNAGTGEDAVKCWRAPVEFPADLPILQDGDTAYKQASLQDYWRWSFGFEGLIPNLDLNAPPRQLSDEELIAAGLLVRWDNQLWHILHRPETNLEWALAQETTGAGILLSVLSARLMAAGQGQSGGDQRLQLVGTRARKIDVLWNPPRSAPPRPLPKEIFIRAEQSEFDDFNASSVTFGGGASFERSRFNGVSDFNEAKFKGAVGFDRVLFGELTDFYGVAFKGAVSFERTVFGAETLFHGAWFAPEANFRHARFGDMADFSSSEFAGQAVFRGCHFGNESSFSNADLGPGAEFMRTQFGDLVTFSHAKLPGAFFEGGKDGKLFTHEVNFQSADLSRSRLRDIDFRGVDARWTGATLDDVEFANIAYEKRDLHGRCEGLKGGASIWGDALLRRDFQDQDYIDTLKSRLEIAKPDWKGPGQGETPLRRAYRIAINLKNIFIPDVPTGAWVLMLVFAAVGGVLASAIIDEQFAAWLGSPFKTATPESAEASAFHLFRAAFIGLIATIIGALFISSWYGRRSIFLLWGSLGYGRDWDRVALLAVILIAMFGVAYQFTQGTHIQFNIDPPACEAGDCADQDPRHHWFMPWFVAVMGFATLGIADVASPLTGLGQLIMITNVLAGFAIFGLLLAVLGNRFARRS